jgi:hypothetical protein
MAQFRNEKGNGMTTTPPEPPANPPANPPADPPPAPPANPPAPPAAPLPTHVPNPGDGGSLKAIQDALNALPERIVHAVREGTQPPQQPPAQPAPNAGKPPVTPGNTQPNKSAREKFVGWWFG